MMNKNIDYLFTYQMNFPVQAAMTPVKQFVEFDSSLG